MGQCNVSIFLLDFRYLLTAGSYISGQFQSTDRLYDSSIGFFISSQKDVRNFTVVLLIVNFFADVASSF